MRGERWNQTHITQHKLLLSKACETVAQEGGAESLAGGTRHLVRLGSCVQGMAPLARVVIGQVIRLGQGRKGFTGLGSVA